MNLIKEYLGSVAGVQFYAITSMVLFILVFVFMVIHAYSLRKEEVTEFSQLPLDENEVDQKNDHRNIND